ncbi:MAG: DUF3152 domain-containing protein, partial [Solirubrobacterales bacterium]
MGSGVDRRVRGATLAVAILWLTIGMAPGIAMGGAVTPGAEAGGGSSPTPDFLLCSGQRATILGTDDDDRITGTRGRDIVAARGGDDHVRGLGSTDVICGGAGSDIILGGAGLDNLKGESGRDEIGGSGGADKLSGGTGADLLDGGGGDDLLLGGSAADELAGGPGTDRLRGGAGAAWCVDGERESGCPPTRPLTAVPGRSPLIGRGGHVYRYGVYVEEGIAIDRREVASTIDGVLGDDLGWTSGGGVSFRRVERNQDTRIILATPDEVDELCKPLETNGKVS